MARKDISNRIDEDLYTAIKILAIKNKLKANDLLEEGMKLVLDKYNETYESK